MARIIRRPRAAIDWGSVSTTGVGNVLGDNNNDTYKFYGNDSGSILVFDAMTEAAMPTAPVIAVMVGFHQSNGGLFGRYNGWVCGFMRVDGTRDPATKTYVQDGYSTGTRQITGPPLYKAEAEAFTVSDIDSLSMDIGSAVGPIGPVTDRRWCIGREAYLILVTAEPVPVPAISAPAASATLSSSSVNFTATLTGHDTAQPTRAVFQVARDSGFTSDVRTFVGDFANAAGSSTYTSVVGKDSHTNLGPGVWYVRSRGRDFRGVESAWGATRSFSVVHPALPVPTVPALGNVSTPYGIRTAVIPSVPLGGRRVGIEWQFSKSAAFDSNVVTWANVAGGRFDAGQVSYDPEPRPNIAAGLRGYEVGYEDPSQYLSQGTWNVRARTIDEWGQLSGWSATGTFTVVHAPSTGNYFPTGGVKFDPETTEVTWEFSDPWPGDRQSSYLVTVYDATLSTVWSSAVTNSPITRARLDLPTSRFGQTLSWAVTVTDADGATSSVSPRQNFLYSRSPRITVTKPGAVIISGRPTISWTTEFSEPGVTQASWRVAIAEVGGSRIVYDTGTVAGPGAGQVSSHLVPQPVLVDGKNYDVRIEITDSNGLIGVAIVRAATQFVRPAQVPVAATAANYATQGYVEAHWSRGPDPMFTEWRLYRRLAGLDNWTLAATSTDPSARSLKDWLASGSEIEYAVTQVASRDGSLIESAPVEPAPSVKIRVSVYMLVVPDLGFALRVRPSSDQFAVAHEAHTMQIIGRGAKVNFGTGRSREGSLSIPLRDPATASLDRMAIDQLVGSQYEVWLRSPFGDAFRVALAEYSFERMPGVGTADLGDLEIPYVEVML